MFRDGLEKEGKFLNNVLTMIEGMLLYLRGTRQQLWGLHLASLDRLTKYFFALDLLNYARMSPFQLSSIFDLRTSDSESWNFLKSNFCVNKTKGSFVALGVNHALEQVNRELKAVGGVVGMSEEVMDKYCYTAPVKRALLSKFNNEFRPGS